MKKCREMFLHLSCFQMPVVLYDNTLHHFAGLLCNTDYGCLWVIGSLLEVRFEECNQSYEVVANL